MAEPPTQRLRDRRRVWVDLGIIVAIAPIAFAAFRLALFSGGDPVILKTIASTIDVPAIVLGTLLPAVPILLFVFIQSSVLDTAGGGTVWERVRQSRIGVMLSLLAVALYILLGPFPLSLLLPLALFAGLFSLVLLRRIRRRRRVRKGLPEPHPTLANEEVMLIVWVVPLLSALLMLLSQEAMWLPLERLDLADGEEVRVYVLRVADTWTTVIGQDRQIRVIPTVEVEERTVCDQSSYNSLLRMLSPVRPHNPGDSLC